jgi:hypothetical protein
MSHFIEFLQATLIWNKVTKLMRKLNEQKLLNSFCFPAPRGQRNGKGDTNWQSVVGHLGENGGHDFVEVSSSTRHLRGHWVGGEGRTEQPYGNLTKQDMFYVQVTRIQSFFGALLRTIESIVTINETWGSGAIVEVNKRQISRHHGGYVPTARIRRIHAVDPGLGKNSLRDVLLQLIQTTQQFFQQTGEPKIRQRYFAQATEPIDSGI